MLKRLPFPSSRGERLSFLAWRVRTCRPLPREALRREIPPRQLFRLAGSFHLLPFTPAIAHPCARGGRQSGKYRLRLLHGQCFVRAAWRRRLRRRLVLRWGASLRTTGTCRSCCTCAAPHFGAARGGRRVSDVSFAGVRRLGQGCRCHRRLRSCWRDGICDAAEQECRRECTDAPRVRELADSPPHYKASFVICCTCPGSCASIRALSRQSCGSGIGWMRRRLRRSREEKMIAAD
jgi:hypothetical protein